MAQGRNGMNRPTCFGIEELLIDKDGKPVSPLRDGVTVICCPEGGGVARYSAATVTVPNQAPCSTPARPQSLRPRWRQGDGNSTLSLLLVNGRIEQ